MLSPRNFFIGAAATSLLILSVTGITSHTDQSFTILSPDFLSNAKLFLISLLLFLGYEQILVDTERDKQQFWWAIAIGFVFLSLWALASLSHVSRVELSSSTVPYILSAREIMGQPGRTLIGIVIIAGSCKLVFSTGQFLPYPVDKRNILTTI